MKPWTPPAAETTLPARSAPVAQGPIRGAVWLTLATSLVAAAALPAAVGLQVDYGSFVGALGLAFPALFAWPYASFRKMRGVQAGLELWALSVTIAVPVLIFTYAAMRLGWPMFDDRFAAADALLGYRAPAYLAWLDLHPWLARGLGLGYSSFIFQIMLLPLLLCAAGQRERGYVVAFTYLLLGIFGSLICTFFPAVGTYVHNGIPPGHFQHIDQKLGYFADQLIAVRTDPGFVLSAARAEGVVAFPSGHAAMALLCGWAGWTLRAWRYPLVLLNGAMFASALSNGAHYLVDLIAGAMLAILSIRLAVAVAEGRLRRPRRRGSGAPAKVNDPA